MLFGQGFIDPTADRRLGCIRRLGRGTRRPVGAPGCTEAAFRAILPAAGFRIAFSAAPGYHDGI